MLVKTGSKPPEEQRDDLSEEDRVLAEAVLEAGPRK